MIDAAASAGCVCASGSEPRAKKHRADHGQWDQERHQKRAHHECEQKHLKVASGHANGEVSGTHRSEKIASAMPLGKGWIGPASSAVGPAKAIWTG